ncbi:hypothetical protein D3C81_2248870 [compost metagenome]
MLQGLEGTDGGTELLAYLEVLDRHVERLLHGADRLCAKGGQSTVDNLLNQREGLPRLA